jgi:hypothetical protein
MKETRIETKVITKNGKEEDISLLLTSQTQIVKSGNNTAILSPDLTNNIIIKEDYNDVLLIINNLNK